MLEWFHNKPLKTFTEDNLGVNYLEIDSFEFLFSLIQDIIDGLNHFLPRL